jgi:cytochrome c-type biogenesis protein CcmH
VLSGRVSLSPALKSSVSPNDTVFVFARAVDGPPMPLAIVRLKVADLPASFRLDDSNAMAPNMNLSSFDKVTVTARVSKSGNAMPQSGDLEASIGPVAHNASGLALLIDHAVP